MKFATHLRALIAGATKLPWKVYDEGDVQSIHYGRKELGGSNTVVNWPGFDSSGVPMKHRKANARLIVHLANHASALAAVVEAAEEVDRIGIGAHLQLHDALAALHVGQTGE